MEDELDQLFQDEITVGGTQCDAAVAEAFVSMGIALQVPAEALLIAAHMYRITAGRPTGRKSSRTHADMVATLVIASKFVEGITSSDVEEMLKIAKIEAVDLLKSELAICNALDWHLYFPSSLSFLRCFSHDADGCNRETRSLARVILIAFIIDPVGCSQYTPSTHASAALYLAKALLDNGTWTKQHRTVCRHTEQEIIPCARSQLSAARRALDLFPAIFKDQHRQAIAKK